MKAVYWTSDIPDALPLFFAGRKPFFINGLHYFLWLQYQDTGTSPTNGEIFATKLPGSAYKLTSSCWTWAARKNITQLPIVYLGLCIYIYLLLSCTQYAQQTARHKIYPAQIPGFPFITRYCVQYSSVYPYLLLNTSLFGRHWNSKWANIKRIFYPIFAVSALLKFQFVKVSATDNISH